MNKKQYNNVIDYTLTHEAEAQSADSLKTARTVFNNMGVALPNGEISEVYETLKTNDYMGWKSCTMQEAQKAADRGTAAIGISKDRIVILSAADEEDPVTQTASVMTISETTPAVAVSDLEYYSYSYYTTENDSPVHFEDESLEVSVGWSGYNPLSGSTTETLCWSCSNSNVASVDYYSGYVRAKKVGTATVTVKTECGTYLASYTIKVNQCRKSVSTEKRIVGDLIAGDADMGILMPQVYNVKLTITYNICQINGNQVFLDDISVYTGYQKTYDIFDVDDPEIYVQDIKLNGQKLNMTDYNSDKIISPQTIWDEKISYVNQWVSLGSNISAKSVVLLDSSTLFYHDVDLSTTIQI